LTVAGVGAFSNSFSDNLTGWTVGGGVEWALFGAWTAKAEYLYVDLGSATDNGTSVFAGVPAFTATNHVTDNIFRAGLNWRFGGGPIVGGY
jgi:outer membrane immunogenic protein